MGVLLLRLPLSLFACREGGRGRDARRWDRASAPGASAKIRSRSSTSDLMTSRSILPRSAECIGGIMAKRVRHAVSTQPSTGSRDRIPARTEKLAARRAMPLRKRSEVQALPRAAIEADEGGMMPRLLVLKSTSRMLAQLEDFQFEPRFRSRAAAVRWLLGSARHQAEGEVIAVFHTRPRSS